jgi:hypothetical protein
MKRILILAFLLISNFLIAQEAVNMYQHDLENIKNLHTITDDVNKKSVLILTNKEKIDFVLFDENFNLNTKLTQNNTDNSKEYLGYSFENTTYYTYWQKNKKTIEVLAIDFLNKNINSTLLPFLIDKKEKIINMFNHQNIFYILTVSKSTSHLNLYIFNKINFEKKSIDCSSFRLLDFENKNVDLWGFIDDQSITVYKGGFKVFDTSSSIINAVSATQKKKIFLTEKNIILVSDINSNFSQFLIIHLNNFTISQKAISKAITFNNDPNYSPQTNSFLIGEKIFIIKFGGESVTVLVRDIGNNLLKNFSFSSATGDDFINSDLKEENGSITSGEVIDKKNVFYRRIVAKNASISGYYKNGNYYLTIAGVSYPEQQFFYLSMFGVVGSTIGMLLEDSSQSSLPSYADKKIVYFKSIIDKDFNGSPEKLPYSSFDKLRLFIEKDNTKKEFLEPFEFQNHLILTGINKKEKRIIFYKF